MRSVVECFRMKNGTWNKNKNIERDKKA
jgi:hypothetical protein